MLELALLQRATFSAFETQKERVKQVLVSQENALYACSSAGTLF